MKLLVYFMRIIIYAVGITPPKPEDENRYALTIFGLLVAMALGMVVITRLLLSAVFSSAVR